MHLREHCDETSAGRRRARVGAHRRRAAMAVTVLAVLVPAGCARNGNREVVVVDDPAPSSSVLGKRQERAVLAPRNSDFCARAGRVGSSTVRSTAAVETSGIVASRTHRDLLWVMNDMGNGPELIGLSLLGDERGIWNVRGATNADWEDLALVPDTSAGQDRLVVGDLGDGGGNRREFDLWVVPEPDPTAATRDAQAKRVTLRYADGGTRDAEALFIDPVEGRIIVISKAWDAGPAGIFGAPVSALDEGTGTLEPLGELNLPALDLTGLQLPASLTEVRAGAALPPAQHMRLVTGADISPDGTLVIVRTYATVHMYQRKEGASVSEALQSPPCQAPTMPEGQGEAVAFLADGLGYVTIGEGVNRPVNRFQLPSTAPLER